MESSEENDLYGLPLADFTKARDELARRLRREGRRDDAEAVKALRKPTVAAWALNQLARRRPGDVERLLATGERLREAQEALLAGGDRVALQRASAEEREMVDKLTRDATAVAGEARTSATGSLEERIRGTLRAAALDQQTADELAAGRLLHEREAAGLFGGASVETASPRKAAPATRPRGRAAEPAAKQERDRGGTRMGPESRKGSRKGIWKGIWKGSGAAPAGRAGAGGEEGGGAGGEARARPRDQGRRPRRPPGRRRRGAGRRGEGASRGGPRRPPRSRAAEAGRRQGLRPRGAGRRRGGEENCSAGDR